jgi:colicin import membrane protein
MEATLQVTKVDPSEFGLNIELATSITKDLPAIIQERDILAQQYSEIITLDIEDATTAKLAKEIRLKIKNNRTKGIEAWHKVNKEYFLKGGQFIDAIKRKESAENERMEQALEEIEKYQENLEKQRIEQIHANRIELLKGFVEDTTALKLGEMEEDVWEAYLSAKITSYKNRIAADEQAEQERIAKEKAEAEERERMRIENERLKREAEEREAAMRKQQAEAEKKLAEERAKAEAERKAAEATLQAERAAAEAERKRIELEESIKREAERKERLRIEAELQAKKDAEAKAEAERQATIEAELNKGDREKFSDLLYQLEQLKGKYEFKSAKYKTLFSSVYELIDKTTFYAKSKL